MAEKQRYETEWEGLRLVIEQLPDHYQAFVYDPKECEVLYICKRARLDLAQFAAVEYAAAVRFGPDHSLKPEILSAMLGWDEC